MAVYGPPQDSSIRWMRNLEPFVDRTTGVAKGILFSKGGGDLYAELATSIRLAFHHSEMSTQRVAAALRVPDNERQSGPRPTLHEGE